MHDSPSGAELAGLAHALGASDALARRCHAIAAREAAAGDGAFAACRAVLTARYGAADDRLLLERLVADIRAGALDEASADRPVLAALLRAITREKLRACNPDYLEA